MTQYAEVPIGEFFDAVNGRAKYIRDYIDAHRGQHPVYSASLLQPFGYVDGYDFDGHFLTWVMNGYGGRVQEIAGQFSVNRDRGVLVPRLGKRTPDLSYLRFVMEPQLMAAAVGRRVEGRSNDYTKLYPDDAKEVVIQLPMTAGGEYDYDKMSELGSKFRRIEAAQTRVRNSRDSLFRAVFVIEMQEPSITLTLGDRRFFALSIGERVLRSQHTATGVPVYSANARIPFGAVESSNLDGFERPSLLWGIDGNFDWNLIPAREPFATTDHCGRLQILDEAIDPEYVYWFLQSTRGRYGFDRVYRASLANLKEEVTVTLPMDANSGGFSLERQRALAEVSRTREGSRTKAATALADVLKARIPVDSF